MILVIAEKPSLAKAIRAAVGGEYTVTNLYGHMYEQDEPDDYLPDTVPKNSKGNKIWRMEDLPIVPTEWKLHPKKECKEQIGKIKELLKSATSVVNAGDPDREGQLLVDELIQQLKYKGEVKRVWLKSLTPEAIKTAFQNLKPNSQYIPLRDAALARSHADWLVGLNLTRAWTVKSSGLMSVGRVQTPTLSMIVARDLAIENFKASDYFDIVAHMKHAGGEFVAKWKPANTEGAGFDEDGRLTDKAVADRVAGLSGDAHVDTYKSEAKKRFAPLPFSLSALQKKASAKYGFGAQKVLDLAQELYDEQYTSYPRTDCQYLGTDQIDALKAVCEGLAVKFGVKVIDIKHSAFNDTKVTAHTAIVPTNKNASGLVGDVAKLYDMIARSTVALFCAPEEYQAVSVSLEMGGEDWTASGKTVTSAGWTALYGGELDEDEENEPALPVMKVGDAAQGKVEVKSAKTKPPKRFTEGALIDAMANIHRYIEDPAARAKLKETAGIGTDATRSNVIETLFRRSWIETKGKAIISTASGRSVIAALPADLKDPVTTAQWEDRLSEIAAGKESARAFEASIVVFLGDQLSLAKGSTAQLPSSARPVGAVAASAGAGASKFKEAPCPVCKGVARRLESKKKAGTFYWACGNRDHGLMGDEKGKPGKEFGK